MNDDLIASIEDLGLSQKEARVYLANLMLGPATVQKIADQSGIKRVTTYVILESLNNLGLVSQSSKGKKTYFVAEEPGQLKRLLQKKEQEVKDQRKSFEAILPDLEQLKSIPTESPNVRFYDTSEGIRAVMASFLSQHSKGIEMVYGFSNLDQVHEFFPEILEKGTNPDRVRAGLKSRVIYTSEQGPVFHEDDSAKGRESRFIPADLYPFKGDLTIVGDNLVLLSLGGGKPIGVTIASKTLSETVMALFKLAWEAAEKYNN